MSSIEIDYRHSALIVWDMQYGIAKRAFNFEEVVKNAKLLIETARKSNIPVIYSQATPLPFDYMSKYSLYTAKRRGMDPRGHSPMAEGSEAWQIVSELHPTGGDLVFKKHTPSFFVGTALEQVLRGRQVDTLILCGVSTEVGIDGTARHGAYLGFLPVIAEDAVGSPEKDVHENMLSIMRRMFEVKSTREIIDKFQT